MLHSVFGGVSTVSSGNFHQLQPVGKSEEILYSLSPGGQWWENTINCAIFLENSHRFKDDTVYGEIMQRMRMGQDTKEDRRKRNTRVMGKNNVELPDPDTCHACPTNKERNGRITAGIFRNHIMEMHPAIDSDEMPPAHTLMVEASMKKKTQPVSRAIHDIIVARLGDDGIHSTMFASQGAKIDPVLRLFPGSLFMCTTTNDDRDKGRNDTVCKCVQVKLKSPDALQWKNCEERSILFQLMILSGSNSDTLPAHRGEYQGSSN